MGHACVLVSKKSKWPNLNQFSFLTCVFYYISGLRLAKIVLIIGLSGFLGKYKVTKGKDSTNRMKYERKRIRFLTPAMNFRLVVEKRN